MAREGMPPNLYGFRSSILGISPDRIVILAIFSVIAYVVSGIEIIASFLLLLSGILLAFYRREREALPVSFFRFVKWRFSRKERKVGFNVEVSNEDFTYIREHGKTGILLSLETDEIYDVSTGEFTSTVDDLRRALNEVAATLQVIVTSHQVKKQKEELPENRGAREYYAMVARAINSVTYHRVFLIISGPPERDKLRKIAGRMENMLSLHGFAIRKELSTGEVEALADALL